ncbi:YegS/Rv2252/BmrU family lipid kinase [bacterium]|jgi:YegS/Rv2252/BmrU family lipid kinase|nr:YegS/Rv2252/BmrU family lipid kinase [bacterium]
MENHRKWAFIVNPVAGSGYALTLVGKIREMIAIHHLDAEIALTERKGHATELAQHYAANGYNCIVGVGGDGTMNEIAAPLINRKDIVIGLIGGGTGNDFIQVTGFPDRFQEEDWATFFRVNVMPMDVGICNGKIILNGMGLGFDAQVASENYTESGEVKPGGKVKYIWHILKTLFFYQEKRVKMIYNGETHDTDCFMNTVANGRRFAGSFYLTPKAQVNDSLLDVCAIKRLNLFQRLKILLMVPSGTHIRDKHVNYYQTDRLVLEFPTRMPYHIDGELFFAQRFEVGVLPGALNIIYNPSGNHFFRVGQEAGVSADEKGVPLEE